MSGKNYFDINHEINFTGKLNRDYDKFNEKRPRKNKNEEIYGIFYGDLDLDEESEDIDDPYIKKTQKKQINKQKGNKKQSYREIALNQKFTSGRDKYLNLNNSRMQKNEETNKKLITSKDNSENIYSDSGSDSAKIFSTKPAKVKITQINVDDEDRIKEDFVQKIIEGHKTDKDKGTEGAKSKGELSKEYSKTFGKGFAMLKKIGFQVGKGLGVKEQGITQPIEIKKRERNKGISTEDDFLNLKKKEEGEEEDDISENNEFFSKKDIHMHKQRKLHKLKAGKKEILKAKDKKEQKAKEDLDEFEKLVDNWDLIKEIIEKRKNKKIDFAHMENIENDIDLVLERDVDIDVSKFLLEKSNNDFGDFIGLSGKMKKSFFDKYNLKSYLRQSLKKRVNKMMDVDVDFAEEQEKTDSNNFSFMFLSKLKSLYDEQVSKIKEKVLDPNMMILEDKDQNFNEVLQNKIDFDEFNDFILDFIKENKRKSINYYLDFKEKDDDIFTFEYQLQDQNQKIKQLTESNNEKKNFYLDLKALKAYIKKYCEANKIKDLTNANTSNIKNPNKDEGANKISNQEELNFSFHSRGYASEASDGKEYDSDNIFTGEANKYMFNELELLEKFDNLFENHKRMKMHFKDLSALCVNILLICFKSKFTFLDFSASAKRRMIKDIILKLKNFLHSSLNNNSNHISDRIKKDFVNLKNGRNGTKDIIYENGNDNVWEIYENHNMNESEDYDEFEDLDDEIHMFGRKTQHYKDKEQKKIKYADRLLGYFLFNTCIEDLSNFIINVWNVKEFERITNTIEEYKDIFPYFIKEYLFSSVILPKLFEAIDSWQPGIDKVLINDWIFPWLDLLGFEKMELLMSKIQEKLDKFAIQWAPDDLSLISILLPWKKFFNENYWDNFFSKYIIPKLNYIVSKTEINPKDQKIDSIKILFIWSELIPLKQISEILMQNFFPKFIETFKLWLSQNPKIEELLKWYEGWKKVFSNKNLLESSTEMQNVFKIILTLLNNYLVKTK